MQRFCFQYREAFLVKFYASKRDVVCKFQANVLYCNYFVANLYSNPVVDEVLAALLLNNLVSSKIFFGMKY